jgi:outer membrane protein, heavy metal efflux system
MPGSRALRRTFSRRRTLVWSSFMAQRTLLLVAGTLVAGTLVASRPAAAQTAPDDGTTVARADDAPVSASQNVPIPVPSLSKVVELARDRAPAVLSGRAAVNVSSSALVGARLNPLGNPYLEVFADRGGQNATRDIAIQSNLWLPVDLSGQREKREAEARALVQWTGAELDATRAAAAADAVRAYGQLVVAGARIQTIEDLSRVAVEEASYYEQRLEKGDATLADTTLAELERAKYAVSLAEARADRTRALAALSLATGTTYSTPPSGSLDPPAPKVAAAPKDAAALPTVRASAAQAEFHAREKDRQAIEAHAPVNLIVTAGRGDLGELRLGGGVSWTFPLLRTNQGEQARAEANRAKASLERGLKERAATVTAAALVAERQKVRQAIETVTKIAEPAAQAAVDAAVATQAAGKGDLLRVLSARRDLALLQARRLELLQREWNIVGDLVALTGELP